VPAADQTGRSAYGHETTALDGRRPVGGPCSRAGENEGIWMGSSMHHLAQVTRELPVLVHPRLERPIREKKCC
jgi:hypothetical protein